MLKIPELLTLIIRSKYSPAKESAQESDPATIELTQTPDSELHQILTEMLRLLLQNRQTTYNTLTTATGLSPAQAQTLLEAASHLVESTMPAEFIRQKVISELVPIDDVSCFIPFDSADVQFSLRINAQTKQTIGIKITITEQVSDHKLMQFTVIYLYRHSLKSTGGKLPQNMGMHVLKMKSALELLTYEKTLTASPKLKVTREGTTLYFALMITDGSTETNQVMLFDLVADPIPDQEIILYVSRRE